MSEQELRRIIREELDKTQEERKKNKSVFAEVMDAAEEEMERLGMTKPADRYTLRNAVSTIMRAAFGVDSVKKIPNGKKEEIASFVNVVMQYIAVHRTGVSEA